MVAPSDLRAGALLAVIASGRAKSRSELIEALGWSRATLTQRLGFLLSAGLLDEAPETLPSGGRPSRILRVNTGFAVVLTADIGERSIRLAATDLAPKVLVEFTRAKDVGAGPLAILGVVAEGFVNLLHQLGRSRDDVLGIGLSLPAPVDFLAGRVVGPSVMRGWDDFDIRGWMETRFEAPVLVENDVNLMTLAEARRFWPQIGQLFYVKLGTGIGSGVIADGRLYRGAQGAAGDIGHIQIPCTDGPLCRCGKLGCVEASAGGWAVARDLRALGLDCEDARGVLALVQAGNPHAISLVRKAGRIVGEVMASVVSVLNPSVIVVGGTLAGAGEHLLSGIRELVYQRCLPLATRDLSITTANAGEGVNIIGAATLVLESQLRPGAVEQVVARHARGMSSNPLSCSLPRFA
ncbi:MAG: ROK family protein [Janthinobacterium lividum]